MYFNFFYNKKHIYMFTKRAQPILNTFLIFFINIVLFKLIIYYNLTKQDVRITLII